MVFNILYDQAIICLASFAQGSQPTKGKKSERRGEGGGGNANEKVEGRKRKKKMSEQCHFYTPKLP